MKRKTWETKAVKIIEIGYDLLIILVSFFVSLLITHVQPPSYFFQGDEITTQLLVSMGFIVVVAFALFRIYRITIFHGGFIRNILKIIISLVFIGLTVIIAQLIYPNYQLRKAATALMLPIAFAILFISNKIFYGVLKKTNVWRALICGPHGEVEAIAKKIFYDETKFTTLKYIVYDDFDLANPQQLYDCIDAVDSVYLTEGVSPKMRNAIISYCMKVKKYFYVVPGLYELSLNKAYVSQVSDTLIFGVKGLGLTIEQMFFKRAFDLFVASIFAIVFLPLMLIIALVIKLYDRGPVFFKQKRMTINNRIFTLYKFRSMIVDAEKNTGAIQATKNDKRITPLGKFLRKTRLDELPQLINVLRGDMSIVGPRALRVEEMEEFALRNPEFMYRLNVKAGVTGYAQTMGKYYTHFRDKLNFDIFYITNYSFFNDIVIIFQTAASMFDPTSAEGVSRSRSLSECLVAEGYSLDDSDNENIKVINKQK